MLIILLLNGLLAVHVHAYGFDNNLTTSDVLSLIDDLCSYDEICKQDDLDTGFQIKQPNTSCCQPCLCTNNCIPGNCCPASPLHPTRTAKCVSQFELFNKHRGRSEDVPETFDKHYYVVFSCPVGSNETYNNACMNPITFGDHVLVSSMNNSVIFKNANCAKCNGIFEYITWDILLYKHEMNQDPLENKLPSIREHWFDEYNVYSQPLLEDKSFVYVHECMPTFDSAECPKRIWGNDKLNLAVSDVCKRQGPLYWYKGQWLYNVFCFACVKGIYMPEDKLCPDSGLERTSTMYSFSIVIDVRSFGEDRRGIEDNSQCESSQTLNPITNSCTNLFCPIGQFPFQGHCFEMAYRTNGFTIEIPLHVNISVPIPKVDMGDVFQRLLIPHLRKHFDGCSYCVSFAYLPETDHMFYSYISFATTSTCNESFMLKALNTISEVFERKYIMIRSKRVGIQVSINDIETKNTLVILSRDVGYYRCKNPLTLTSKFYCPYIEENKTVTDKYYQTHDDIQTFADTYVIGNQTFYRMCLSDLRKLKHSHNETDPSSIMARMSTISHSILSISSLFTLILSFTKRGTMLFKQCWNVIICVLTFCYQLYFFFDINCNSCSSLLMAVVESLSQFASLACLSLFCTFIIATLRNSHGTCIICKATYIKGGILALTASLLFVTARQTMIVFDIFHDHSHGSYGLPTDFIILGSTYLAPCLIALTLSFYFMRKLPFVPRNNTTEWAGYGRQSRTHFKLACLFSLVLCCHVAEQLLPLLSLVILFDVVTVGYSITLFFLLVDF